MRELQDELDVAMTPILRRQDADVPSRYQAVPAHPARRAVSLLVGWITVAAGLSALVVFLALWLVSVGTLSAANRVYHRARVDCEAGRANLVDVCDTSRRLCESESLIPFVDQDRACLRHLKRLVALGEVTVPTRGRDGESPAAGRKSLRTSREEAELWVRRGWPRPSPVQTLRRLVLAPAGAGGEARP